MKPSKCFRHDMFPWKAVRANLSAINTSAHLRFIISLVARAGFAPAFRGYEPLVLSYATTAPEIRIRKWKWSGWQELNLRGHVPKTCGWPLPYTRIWRLGTELNRIHWLFRPALCRRVPEPNLVDSARLELAFHGCRPWVIPLYEPPMWGEMRESNSRDWSHNPVPKPFGQSRHRI